MVLFFFGFLVGFGVAIAAAGSFACRLMRHVDQAVARFLASVAGRLSLNPESAQNDLPPSDREAVVEGGHTRPLRETDKTDNSRSRRVSASHRLTNGEAARSERQCHES